jgi:hypothetical protein
VNDLPAGMSDAEMGEALVREIGRQGAFDLLLALKDPRQRKVEAIAVKDDHGVNEFLVSGPWRRSSPRRQRSTPARPQQSVENPLTSSRKTA